MRNEDHNLAEFIRTVEPMKAHLWTEQTLAVRGLAVTPKIAAMLCRAYARLVVLYNFGTDQERIEIAEVLGIIDEKLDTWEGVERSPGHWQVEMTVGVLVEKAHEVAVRYTFETAEAAAAFEKIINETLEKRQGEKCK